MPNLDSPRQSPAEHTGRSARCCAGAAPVWPRSFARAGSSVLPRLLIGELHKFPDLARFYKATVVDRALALIAACIATASKPASSAPRTARRWPAWSWPRLLLMAVWRAVFAPHEAEPFDPARVLDAHVDTLLRGLAA